MATWGRFDGDNEDTAWFNVLSYNADPLGVEDCSAKVTAAMTAAAAAGGGVVYFPRGKYLFNSTVDIPAGVSVRGDCAADPGRIYEHTTLGDGSQAYDRCTAVIAAGSGLDGPIFTMTGSGMTTPHFPSDEVRTAHDGNYQQPGTLNQWSTIQDLYFWGNEDNNRTGGSVGVLAKGIIHAKIKDCTFSRFSSYSIRLRDCAAVVIDSCYSHYTDRGLLFDDATDCMVLNSVFGGSYGPAVWLNSVGSWKNTFSNCQAWNTVNNEISATLNVPSDAELLTWDGPGSSTAHRLFTGDPVTVRNNGLTVSSLTTTHFRITSSPSVASGGTGYAVGDVLTVDSGTANVKALVEVLTLSGSAVATVEIKDSVAVGDYTATPSSATAGTTALTGSGTGCTLDTTGSTAATTLAQSDTFYVIRVSDTTFKLAMGYDQAVAGQALEFSGSDNGTLYVYSGRASGYYLSDQSQANTFAGCRADQCYLDGVVIDGANRNSFSCLLSQENGWNNGGNLAGVSFAGASTSNIVADVIVQSQEYGVSFGGSTTNNAVLGLRGSAATAMILDSSSAGSGNSWSSALFSPSQLVNDTHADTSTTGAVRWTSKFTPSATASGAILSQVEIYPSATGSETIGHFVGAFSKPQWLGSGTGTFLSGFFARPFVNSGTVTETAGIRIDDATGGGTVTTQDGVYIANLTKGSGANIGIRSLHTGKHYWAGYHEIAEIADPGSSPSNTARLYVKDNGSGKTQLVVVFPTGAVQVLATEP